MSISFELFVTYSQIAIFDPTLKNPFNDWQKQHNKQGFAWRPKSVSFGTLEDGGLHKVEIHETDKINLKPNTKRAILVPFESSGLVEIASISEAKRINIHKGSYSLVFEIGYDGSDPWCVFTFLAGGSFQAKILRLDSELSPSYPLLMEANPAI